MELLKKIKGFFLGEEREITHARSPTTRMNRFIVGGFDTLYSKVYFRFFKEELLNQVYFTFDIEALESLLRNNKGRAIPFNPENPNLSPDDIQELFGRVFKYKSGYYLVCGENSLARIRISPRDSYGTSIITIRCYERTTINKYRLNLELSKERITLLDSDLLPIHRSRIKDILA